MALAGFIVFSKLKQHGKFPGGTTVAGIELSYKTPEEALKLLSVAQKQYLDRPIKISYSGKTKEFKPPDLGIQISTEKTLGTLKKIDAKGKGILEILFSGGSNENHLPLVVFIDQEKMQKTLNTAFKLDELAPKSAIFYFDEKSKLAIKDGVPGLSWDKKSISEELKDSAKELTPLDVLVVSTEKKNPNIDKARLEKEQESIKQSLNHEFVLLDPVYSDDWEVKLSDHLDWVSFKEKQRAKVPFLNTETVFEDQVDDLPTTSFIAIEIDQTKLNGFVDEKISKWLDRPAQPVKMYKNEAGKVVIEGQGDNGLQVQRPALKHAIEMAVAEKIRDVPIPVIEILPELKISDELMAMGIKERISIGHTSYYGSPKNRVHNINVGKDKFNGLLIAPGETFSFNKTLGPVDAANGYKKELVIKKEGTLPDFGGGICQVSTTMFRAALFAGLGEIKRNQHSYAVSYYSQILGHGLDATIFLGGPDLKFKNDTGHYILIQTYTEGDYELYIVFYGTSDGRKVEMEGPYISNHRAAGKTQYIETTDLAPGEKKQVEKAHAGFDALWYRHITLPNGEKIKETIATKYKAMSAKILVGVEKAEEVSP